MKRRRKSFYYDRAWRNAHPEFNRRVSTPIYSPDRMRPLKVWNEFYSAETVFLKHQGIWTCVNPPPILSWMKGLDPASVKIELIKHGCSWEWLPDKDTVSSRVHTNDPAVRPGMATVGLSVPDANLPTTAAGHVTAR